MTDIKVIGKTALILCVALVALSVRATAQDLCNQDTRTKIWIPSLATQSGASNVSTFEDKVSLPILLLNASSILRSDVAASLTIAMHDAASRNQVNEQETATFNYAFDRPALSMADAFQSKYQTIIYVLNMPDGGKKSARTKSWTADLLKSMRTSPQTADQIFEMSERHCFRGAMLFNKVGSTTLSLFIWNAEIIDAEEVKKTSCLFDAFISKKNVVLTSPDRAGRRFLNTCN